MYSACFSALCVPEVGGRLVCIVDAARGLRPEDFLSYSIEWNRRFGEAEDKGGLTLSEPAKCWLFWTNAGVSEAVIADLRLKVNGDLNRWREMVSLQQRISKNESAARDQDRGYRKSIPSYYGDDHHEEDDYDYDYDHDTYWGEDYDYDYDAEHESTYQDHFGGKKGKKGKHSKGNHDYQRSSSPGKGKQPYGDQCTTCGSKYHRTADCPVEKSPQGQHYEQPSAAASSAAAPADASNAHTDDWESYEDWYGKGKGKGKRRKGKGKRFGAGSGGPRFPRPLGFRPSKGKSKGGKGRRTWFGDTETYTYLNFPVGSEPSVCEDELSGLSEDDPGLVSSAPDTPLHADKRAGMRRIYSELFGKPQKPSVCVPQGSPSPGIPSEFPGIPSDPKGLDCRPVCLAWNESDKIALGSDSTTKCSVCGNPYWDNCALCSVAFCSSHGCRLDSTPKCFKCIPKSNTAHPAPLIDVPVVSSTPVLKVPNTDTDSVASFELIGTPESTPNNNVITYEDRLVNADNTVVLPAFSNHKYILLMTIKGRKQLGLIVDPGAARGVLGCDTLLEIKMSLLEPLKLAKFITWFKSQSKFSGISSAQEHSLGLCHLPIGLRGIPWSIFHADILGGSASLCPGLVPLHSLMTNAEFMHFAFFDNGDGILGVRHLGRIEPQRLCLTDSGHYLLKIDQFDTPSDQHLNKAIADRMYNHLMATGRTHHARWKAPHSSVVFPVFVEDDRDFSDFP